MVMLPHYGVCSDAEDRVAAWRESCPVLLSALAVRSTGVVLAMGQPELSSEACVQRSAVPEPLSMVLSPIVALLILKVVLVFFFNGS